MYAIKKIILLIVLFKFLDLTAIRTTLLIKIPTRSRPSQFFKTLDTYYSNLSGTIPYTFLITCDAEDKRMNNKYVIRKLQKYPNLVFSFNGNHTKVEAYNKDVGNYKFDIVIAASDDIIPTVKNFDLIIYKIMKETFPDFDGALNINDGTIGRLCNTIPILGYKYYKRFDYIYHPAYKALVCDVELTNVSKILKKEKVVDQILMMHNHPAWGLAATDNLYQKNELYHLEDKRVFAERRLRNFDLPQEEIDRATPKLWSILICTTRDGAQVDSLCATINSQIKALGLERHIEILYNTPAQCNYTIGLKRNLLLEQSSGKYVSFIDETDTIHDKYVELICEKLVKKPDCINLSGFMNNKNKKFIFSTRYSHPYEIDNQYFGPPTHINAIKRSIAAQFMFSEKHPGDDAFWSVQLNESGLLRTEEFIEDSFYFTNTNMTRAHKR